MIGESLIDLFFGLFSGLFSTLDFLNIPLDLMNVLTDFMAYGNWIVGVDVLAIFVASVVFWWVFKMSIGLIVWVWDRLPLT